MKLVCDNSGCDWDGDEDSVLRAPNPFNAAEVLLACPLCREQTLRVVCDQPSCSEPGTWGTPMPGGYRWTCFRHKPAEEPDAQFCPRNCGQGKE